VSHTIARVNNSSSKISLAHGTRIGARYLSVKGESGLDTYEQTFHVKGLKHDVGDLLSILWGV
jgi:hypothetical protein